MAGALKQNFLEAVRLTPAGIAAFLETPLPEAPTITTPADVDAAAIACGVLSKYLLDVFAAFNGLTIVELLLRIGQHNSVLESAMLAGLEYIEGADSAENDITILEPQDGISYTPGEMRFTAEVKNGVCIRMTLNLGGDDLKMFDKNGTWTQFVRMDVGDYTATFTATFDDTTTQSASVSFTIAEYDPDNPPEPPPETPPEPPGGKDNEALKRNRENVKIAFSALTKALAAIQLPYEHSTALLADANAALTAFKTAVFAFLAVCPDTASSTPLKAEMQTLLSSLVTITLLNLDTTTTKASSIVNNVNKLYSMMVV